MCTTVAPPTASTVLNCGPALTPVRYAVARACKATRRPTSCFWRLLVTTHTRARAHARTFRLSAMQSPRGVPERSRVVANTTTHTSIAMPNLLHTPKRAFEVGEVQSNSCCRTGNVRIRVRLAQAHFS